MANSKNLLPKMFLASLDKSYCTFLDHGWPKISVVMPSFNHEQFIERSILSVLNQSYLNLELIIIDGGSTDGTVEVIKKYERYIYHWISEKDSGQSDALNKGFSVASGKIMGWLNSDDLYLPNALINVALSFQKNPSAMVIFGDWLSIDKNDEIIDKNYAFNFNLDHLKYEGFHLNAQSMFWKKQVHDRFSGFDVSLYYSMDYQMIIEFAINEGEKAFCRLPCFLGAFRRYNGQKTANFSVDVLEEHKKIARRYKYFDKYSIIGQFKRIKYRFRRVWWYFRRGGPLELGLRLIISWK